MQVIQYRRALHRIPELDRDLPETLSYLRGRLSPLSCTLSSPIPGALCAFFDFGRPDAIAFRSDADALPITERTGLPFASVHPGRMHACGHDGHMAMVLDLAVWLDQQTALPHNVLLLFQPAEETTGGAKDLCQSGVLEAHKVQCVFGMHLWPELPAGVIASRKREMMSRSCEVSVTITGRSSHIQGRGPGRPGRRGGILPPGCGPGGRPAPPPLPPAEIRPDGERHRPQRGQRQNGSAGQSPGVSGRGLSGPPAGAAGDWPAGPGGHRLSGGGPHQRRVSRREPRRPVRPGQNLGLPFLELEKPVMISEDFSWYQRHLPALFFFLGCGPSPALHADNFAFDESILAKGAAFWKQLAGAF
ncbi:MAG: M20/M25/M40 family metallo-hydrolase [Evtepia gabavorous]